MKDYTGPDYTGPIGCRKMSEYAHEDRSFSERKPRCYKFVDKFNHEKILFERRLSVAPEEREWYPFADGMAFVVQREGTTLFCKVQKDTDDNS